MPCFELLILCCICISILFPCFGVPCAACHLHCGRMAAHESPIFIESMPNHHTKSAVLCCFPGSHDQRGILHCSSKSAFGLPSPLFIIAKFLCEKVKWMCLFLQTAMVQGWSSSLLSAYYPLLLTGASLIVCFWAEVCSHFWIDAMYYFWFFCFNKL